jgi:hypothetical protein
MEKYKIIDTEISKKKKSHVMEYDSLDAALKAKNDMARSYLKTAKLPLHS